jgi:hypothetical protein
MKKFSVLNTGTSGSRILYLLCVDIFDKELEIDFVKYDGVYNLQSYEGPVKETDNQIFITDSYEAMYKMGRKANTKFIYVGVDKGHVRGCRDVADYVVFLDLQKPTHEFEDELRIILDDNWVG